jgi:hypothetical protein
VAPVPPLLSNISSFSFNDKGEVAYLGDDELFLQYGQNVTIVTSFGRAAPGGGKFTYADTFSLNSSGQLVFRAGVTSPGTSGLFLFSKGKLTELIPDRTAASNGVLVSAYSPVFNNAGDVAFTDGTSGLYLFSKGVITPLYSPGSPAPGGGTFTAISQTSMNESDQVVFMANLSTGGSGLFLASGGTITKIIASGDMFPDGGVFSFASGPSINDAGQIAFGGISNGSAKDGGVFLFSAGNLTVLVPRTTALPNGRDFDSAISTSLNNAGQIAFAGYTNSPLGDGVFLFSGGQITQLTASGDASPDGDIFSLGTRLDAQINSAGQILLLSSMTHHNDTLYLYSAGQLTRVAGQGDTVNHSPHFEYPSALAISTGDAVLVGNQFGGDSTFPGGVGYYLASPGILGQNTSLVVNVGETVGNGVITYAPAAAMNRSGQVAMAVATSDYTGGKVLLKSGPSVTTIVGGPGSQVNPSLNPEQLTINNLGQVAFYGYESQPGIFLTSNGQTNLLLSASTAAPGGGTLNYMQGISLNNQDQLAFFAQPTAPSKNGLFLFSNGTLASIALDGSPAPGGGSFSLPFLSSRFGPFINDNGDVAFAAQIGSSGGGSGIFRYSNGILTRIVGPGDSDAEGGTFYFADSPSINASGQVAFFGITTNGETLFVFSNGQISRVVSSGDVLAKQTLGSVDQPQLNENGDLAFTATLSDGTTAVFLATVKATHK